MTMIITCTSWNLPSWEEATTVQRLETSIITMNHSSYPSSNVQTLHTYSMTDKKSENSNRMNMFPDKTYQKATLFLIQAYI